MHLSSPLLALCAYGCCRCFQPTLGCSGSDLVGHTSLHCCMQENTQLGEQRERAGGRGRRGRGAERERAGGRGRRIGRGAEREGRRAREEEREGRRMEPSSKGTCMESSTTHESCSPFPATWSCNCKCPDAHKCRCSHTLPYRWLECTIPHVNHIYCKRHCHEAC